MMICCCIYDIKRRIQNAIQNNKSYNIFIRSPPTVPQQYTFRYDFFKKKPAKNLTTDSLIMSKTKDSLTNRIPDPQSIQATVA